MSICDFVLFITLIHYINSLHLFITFIYYIGSSAPVTQKVTRIYTQRLSLTTDRDEYLRSLDPSLWAVVVSRGLVADHHTTCMRSFGGAIRNQLDQEGKYTMFLFVGSGDGRSYPVLFTSNALFV